MRRKPIALAAIALGLTAAVMWYQRTGKLAHTHCIKQSSLNLLIYADANGGRFPESEKGFGDALLKLSRDGQDQSWIPFFTNADDDGAYFREALARGGDVDESRCSRTYVQGLHRDSLPGIAILFDTHAVKGGDHLYMSPGQPRLREVITVDGSMSKITEDHWPAFVTHQRELLRLEGFTEDAVSEVYPSD